MMLARSTMVTPRKELMAGPVSIEKESFQLNLKDRSAFDSLREREEEDLPI